MTSPVELISGPSTGSAAGEAGERQHGGLDVAPAPAALGRKVEVGERRAGGEAARGATRFTPVAFDANGTVREARGFTSRT